MRPTPQQPCPPMSFVHLTWQTWLFCPDPPRNFDFNLESNLACCWKSEHPIWIGMRHHIWQSYVFEKGMQCQPSNQSGAKARVRGGAGPGWVPCLGLVKESCLQRQRHLGLTGPSCPHTFFVFAVPANDRCTKAIQVQQNVQGAVTPECIVNPSRFCFV